MIVIKIKKQYRTTRPRDLPYGEEPLAVRWHKRQYPCWEAGCPRKAFTESVAEVPPRARLTGRLCRKAAAEVASGRSVSSVAAEYQVSWPVAHRHYAAHADRTERLETNFTDTSGPGRLLGQVASRTGKTVTCWLDARGQAWKDQVRLVAIDPCAVYRSSVQRGCGRRSSWLTTSTRSGFAGAAVSCRASAPCEQMLPLSTSTLQ
jgi:transposase